MMDLIKIIRILLELARDIWREHKTDAHEKEMEEISDDVRRYMRDNYRLRDDSEVHDPEA